MQYNYAGQRPGAADIEALNFGYAYRHSINQPGYMITIQLRTPGRVELAWLVLSWAMPRHCFGCGP